MFNIVAFANVGYKQVEKRKLPFPSPLSQPAQMSDGLFSSPTSINFWKPTKLQSMGTEAAFPSRSILRDFFPLSTVDLLVLSGRKKGGGETLLCAAVSIFPLNIHIFNREAISQTSKQKTTSPFIQPVKSFFFLFLFETRSCSLSSCQLQTHWNTFQLSQTGEGRRGRRGPVTLEKRRRANDCWKFGCCGQDTAPKIKQALVRPLRK